MVIDDDLRQTLEEQLELLAEMGCDEAFGYYLGRAMAPEGIEVLLKSSAVLQN